MKTTTTTFAFIYWISITLGKAKRLKALPDSVLKLLSWRYFSVILLEYFSRRIKSGSDSYG